MDCSTSSPTPGASSNSCPSSQWCHPTISSSVVPFSSCLQSFPASGSFPMSQFFASGGQSTGASAPASVLPMSIQDWFPLGWTCLISLQSKGETWTLVFSKFRYHLLYILDPGQKGALPSHRWRLNQSALNFQNWLGSAITPKRKNFFSTDTFGVYRSCSCCEFI